MSTQSVAAAQTFSQLSLLADPHSYLVPSASHVNFPFACQFRRPQMTKVAVEIDAAAITEDCALIVEAKPTLDIGTARQLVSSLYTIRYVCNHVSGNVCSMAASLTALFWKQAIGCLTCTLFCTYCCAVSKLSCTPPMLHAAMLNLPL